MPTREQRLTYRAESGRDGAFLVTEQYNKPIFYPLLFGFLILADLAE
jgi:hypothetical protein